MAFVPLLRQAMTSIRRCCTLILVPIVLDWTLVAITQWPVEVNILNHSRGNWGYATTLSQSVLTQTRIVSLALKNWTPKAHSRTEAHSSRRVRNPEVIPVVSAMVRSE